MGKLQRDGAGAPEEVAIAVTITAEQMAVVIRAAPATDAVDARIALVIQFALAAAGACVVDYAPKAPDAVHNAAAIRFVGWLYDADPSDPQTSRALIVSGAQSLLAPYREHRAGAIGAEGEPTPVTPSGSGLPPLPDDGHYILTVSDGELAWTAFPAP